MQRRLTRGAAPISAGSMEIRLKFFTTLASQAALRNRSSLDCRDADLNEAADAAAGRSGCRCGGIA
jgi:hypothetical protein